MASKDMPIRNASRQATCKPLYSPPHYFVKGLSLCLACITLCVIFIYFVQQSVFRGGPEPAKLENQEEL